VVPDLDLGDARPRDRGHGRDEAVHLGVQRDLLDERAPVGLERAAIVLDRHAGDLADQPVGDLRGDLAGYQLVLAVEAPADHDVVALVDLGEEVLDVARVVLQVAVHGDEDPAARLLDAGGHGGGLAVVAAEVDDAHPRVAAGDVDRDSSVPSRLPSLTNTISKSSPSGSTASTMAACMRRMFSSSL
jgi:hypothetical protein